MKHIIAALILFSLVGCSSYVNHETVTAEFLSINGEDRKASDTIGDVVNRIKKRNNYECFITYKIDNQIIPDIWTIPASLLEKDKDKKCIEAETRYFSSAITHEIKMKIYIYGKEIESYRNNNP